MNASTTTALPQISGTLDIVIPVYNEGENIGAVLDSLIAGVRTPLRVLICYDRDDDNTLEAVRAYPRLDQIDVHFVRNHHRGAHGAVMAGMAYSTAPWVLVFPADDTFNASRLDEMVCLAREGCEIVTPCRFMPGGCMQGAPWLKAMLVRAAAFTLYYIAGVPSRDASNGFRLFSRRVVEQIPVESTSGFCYSIEWLVKCHRLGWPVGEVPVVWYERKAGQSRFRVIQWLPRYLRWYCYAFATRFLRSRHVALRHDVPLST